jgi:serine/threonine-protein kinase
MLTGRQVFEAQSAMQMIAHHIHTPPDPPSRHAPAPIPADLDAVVMACLAKRPADRPASAEELGELLGQCEVEQPWTRDDAQSWWRTRMEAEKAVVLSE